MMIFTDLKLVYKWREVTNKICEFDQETKAILAERKKAEFEKYQIEKQLKYNNLKYQSSLLIHDPLLTDDKYSDFKVKKYSTEGKFLYHSKNRCCKGFKVYQFLLKIYIYTYCCRIFFF